jgi:hypothetical protein
MSPLNYMRLHDHSSENPRQHWTNASNGKISFHKKCDYVYETSSTYSHGLIIKNATERIHSATGLILSIFNATGLTIP